jgi:two-component system CheB/CheR fusion protein
MDALPALVSYIDRDFHYRLVNDTYARWFKLDANKVEGRHVREILGEAAWEEVRPFMQRALLGETVMYAKVLPYAGGARHVEVTYTPDRDDTGEIPGFVVLVHDVGARVFAERELRDTRNQLQLILDSMPAFVARCDREQRFIWVNRAYADRFSKDPTDFPGRTIIEVLGDRVYELIAPYIKEVLEGSPVEFELCVPYLTLGTRWMRCRYAPVYEAGTVTGWVSVLMDVTPSKELELRLRLSEERHRSLVLAISSLVWSADGNGDFLAGQTEWEHVTGQAVEEYAGLGWVNAFHPEDRVRVLTSWQAAQLTRTPFRTTARLWHAASRSHRYSEGRATPISASDGSVREWIGTFVDVDDRERALEDLRESDRRKDEFLAMLAHELRNPLAPVLNAVEILRLLGPADPMLNRQRDVISRQVLHMKRLLDDLLDVARVSRGKVHLRVEDLDLRDALTEAIEVAQPAIDAKGHELNVSSLENALPVRGDRTRLTQVFSNLLNNAAKYTDPGGTIQLSARAQDAHAVVRVRDNGVGMTEELRKQAFDLFTQSDRSLDRAQGGLGIGLTMVKTLVELHQGAVEAFSEGVGRGSEFVVRLPLSREAAPAGLERAGAAGATAPRTRVLVVDDNVEAAETLALLLELLGHDVLLAHDGLSALELARRERPDLILLDIGLPAMDGYEVARRLRSAGLENVTLVAVTGYGRDEDVRLAVDAGFDRHLAKPVEPQLLRELLSEVRAGGRA